MWITMKLQSRKGTWAAKVMQGRNVGGCEFGGTWVCGNGLRAEVSRVLSNSRTHILSRMSGEITA